MGDQGNATFGLNQPERAANNLATVYIRQISYGTEEMTASIGDNGQKPMEDQLGEYDRNISKSECEIGDILFLNATGGKCKTFTINLLLAQLAK